MTLRGVLDTAPTHPILSLLSLFLRFTARPRLAPSSVYFLELIDDPQVLVVLFPYKLLHHLILNDQLAEPTV